VTLATLAFPARAALPPAPIAKQIPVTDVYYGTKVVDPYRWMEEPKSSELAAHLKAQDDRTRAILASIPGRKALVERLKALGLTVSTGVVLQNGCISSSEAIRSCTPRSRARSRGSFSIPRR
jgi:hypothetical protein